MGVDVRTINIDVSDLYRGRGRSGIQRVVREVASRLIGSGSTAYRVRVLRFDYVAHRYLAIAEQSALDFLAHKEEEPATESTMAISEFGPDDIFLDVDSAWNSPLKRPYLYPELRKVGAMIVTVVYDLLPLQFPDLAHPSTLRNWSQFISAVYTWSDLVFVISRSVEEEFLRHKELVGETRHIPTVVIKLGADFAVHAEPTHEELAALAQFRDEEYILYVSTIEPRKMHSVALDAIALIHATRPDVHIVFAGRLGWHSDETHTAIVGHPLFGKRVHWIDGPSDALLETLYRECAMTLYLSRGEGYGLPVAESLELGKITISSINTSMYEVGGGFADYVHFNTATEVAETALAYFASPALRERRVREITEKFKPVLWDVVVGTISTIFDNLPRAREIASLPRPSGVQWVFISNVPDSLRRTIPLIDNRVSWVSEYLVIAPESLREEMTSIPSAHPIRFVADEGMLGDDLAEFRLADHQRKNWMLRSRLVTLDEVADEYIMLDDDNQPIVDIDLDVFIGDEPRYRGYYYYELTRWPHRRSPYDFGQGDTRDFLKPLGFELLSYSSHQAQVINKALYAEVVELANAVAPHRSIDEWTSYFNYLASRYPTLVEKRPFKTLNWPEGPWSWQHQYEPKDVAFENYYPYAYLDGSKSGLAYEIDFDTRVAHKRQQEESYDRSRDLMAATIPLIERYQLAHGAMVFTAGETSLMVFGVPHVIPVGVDSVVRLPLTFNLFGRAVEGMETQFCYRVVGRYVSHGMIVENGAMPEHILSNGLMEFDMSSDGLAPGVYDIEFFAKVAGENYFVDGVSYRSRLVVCAPGETVPSVFLKL